MTYSRRVLESAVEDVSGQRVLGTLLNYHNDNLVFNVTNTASLVKKVEPTKRNVISTASKTYDPLGMISPKSCFNSCARTGKTRTNHWKVLASQSGRDW